MRPHTVIIGGGPAGFFAAITCKTLKPELDVILLEKTQVLLTKVRISGGGRCNVTHACFEPALLAKNYPRGSKELLGPFNRFQAEDTVKWFEAKGVELKVEADGRMFPTSDSSETIIKCLTEEAKKVGVSICTGMSVEEIKQQPSGFSLSIANAESMECDKLLIATGSNPKALSMIQSLGHTVEKLVPSLFTFNCPTSPLLDLAGIALDRVHLQIQDTQLELTGPLLITHWGFSGPCVLKLSAWGAKELFQMGYKAKLIINWLGDRKITEVQKILQDMRSMPESKFVIATPLFGLPKNLWKKLALLCGISEELRFQALSNKQLMQFVEKLCRDIYQIDGKTTYKQEFVTCGGIKLDEVNFKTMESKIVPHLYFAGEVLNIDGITGGFNFQNAWTTGYLSGKALASVAE